MPSGGPTTQQTNGNVIDGPMVVTGIDEFKAVDLALSITATIITLFRLGERIRQHRLWLDDAWVALAMVFNIISSATTYLYLFNYAHYPQGERVALFYVIVSTFSGTVWASRTSILFTVIRLTAPSSVLRRALMFIFAAFLVTWAILFAQPFWCDLGEGVAIAQIITDVIADALLVIIPSQLVYKVKLRRPQKIRIISIFSASAITTVVCTVHSYYVFIGGGLNEGIAALFEANISLIVANLSVVVAFLFRIGTEEKATFSPKELGSVTTFGSQLVWQAARRDPHFPVTLASVEVAIVRPDDLGSFPSAGRKVSGNRNDVEVCIPANPALLPDV